MTIQPDHVQELSSDLGRPVNILLVEDSPSDVAMVVAVLREGRVASVIHTVSNGEAALEFLYREGAYVNEPRPDLILLDLNLPRKDGREVLAEIKGDERFKSIPVVILTTSSAESDVLRSYELHANSYVTKPVGFEPFLESMRGIEEFWLSLAHLPDSSHDSIG